MDTTVKTVGELATAIDAKTPKIEVVGDLRGKLRRALTVFSLSKWKLGILAAAIAAIPISGGLTALLAASIAVGIGLEAMIIMDLVFVGWNLALSIYREYDISTIEKDSVLLTRK
jgi:hypothetical protein